MFHMRKNVIILMNIIMGKLISDKRFAEEIIYEYDSRGNVVLQLTKNRINGKIDRLVSRKITYE